MGTKLSIWKQGQFYPSLGKKEIELPYDVQPGPSDAMVKIEGISALPDLEGNFLKGGYSEDALDAIHTFGAIRLVIDLYEKFYGNSIKWSWQQSGENTPLKVRIRNSDINARFLVEHRLIELDCYGKSEALIYNCRTVDLVAHETGHAIVNSIFPKWQNGNPETRGIEEAFCDLTAMFLVLSQQDLCEEIIRETKGDLSKSSILTLFGVGHGYEGNPYREIRSAINSRKYNEYDWSPYAFCEVLVAVLYEILIDLFTQDALFQNTTDKLFNVGALWTKAVITTYFNCPDENVSLAEFAMIFENNLPTQKENIKKHFKERDLNY